MGDVDVQPHVLRFGVCSLVGCQFSEARKHNISHCTLHQLCDPEGGCYSRR